MKRGNGEPYLMMRNVIDAATGQQLIARWYRVGVVNRSHTNIDDVQVQAWRMNPLGFAGLPQPLHLMNDNPTPPNPYQQSFTVAPDREPTQFVDVVVKVVNQPLFQLQHIASGVSPHFPGVDMSSPFGQVGTAFRHAPDTSYLIWKQRVR